MKSSDSPPNRPFKTSLITVASLLLSGFLLQLAFGSFNRCLLRFPVNMYFLIALLVFVVFLSLRPQSRLFQWLSGIPLSVCNIGAILLYTLILGLVPQATSVMEESSVFGFDAVTHSWPFILLYSFILINLSCVITHRLIRFSWKHYAFYLNHLGLLFLLIAIGLGASDRHSYIMQVEKGATENHAYNEQEGIRQLPLSIKLIDFGLEAYLPKLMLTDPRTGEPAAVGKARFWEVDTLHTTGNLADWHIRLMRYIDHAIPSDNGTYCSQEVTGACPAVLVQLENKSGSVSKTGWICCGNFAQPQRDLSLNDTLNLMMSVPEPKLYRSDVIIFNPDGKQVKARLKVNTPLRSSNWRIYQYGYDAKHDDRL